jgi:plasmid stabilization system protein ParE
MKKAVKRKVEAEGGAASILRSLFRSFAKLAEQAGDGRPLLRGLRVAHDPTADRFVVVHSGSRVEFVLVLHGEAQPPCAEVDCRRMDAAGATEETTIARFRFNETGVVTESTVAELVNEKIDLAPGAWSIVAAVIWNALQA